MNRRSTLALAALALLLVPGCLDAQVLGLTPVERMSGVWDGCGDAVARGVSGDPCTFSGACSSSPVGAPVPTAFCRPDGWLVVYTAERVDGEALDRPRVRDDGCIEPPTPFEANTRLCVTDAMLPSAPREAPFDLDADGACAALVDATPGLPCDGTTICAFGHVDDIWSAEGADPVILRPGILAWCHGGRIRTAAAMLTMPCQPTAVDDFISCAY